jgi:hypothetical protein
MRYVTSIEGLEREIEYHYPIRLRLLSPEPGNRETHRA